VHALLTGDPSRRDGRGLGRSVLHDPLLYGVGICAALVCVPFFRYVEWLGDEGVLLHGATRILGGEVLYRDFFEFLAPGGFLIVATWMKLFGVDFGSVRVLALGVVAATAALLYAAARLSSGNRPLAALLAIAWAVFSQGAWTGVIHHWLTTAASMASAVGLFLALEGSPGRGAAFAAGLFAGTAAMVTQSRGGYLCVAVLAALLPLPSARSRLVSAIAGEALVPTAMVLYLAAQGTLPAAFDDVITYPLRHHAGIQPVPYGSWVSSQNWVLVALFPLTFALAGATLVLAGAARLREPRFSTSLALAVVGLLGIFPRPDATHIDFTVALAGPLFALTTTDLLGRLQRRLGRRARLAVGALLIGLCFPGVRGALEMIAAASRTHAVPTARGLVVPGRGLSADDFAGDFAALVAQIDRVSPGDPFFFYPFCPMLPYLTGRRHVAAIDVMTPGYTSVEHFRETCTAVMREAQWVVIEHNWSDPNYLHMVFPAIRDTDPPEKRAFEAGLRLAFANVVHTSTTFELRQRTGRGSEALCDTIGARSEAR
jgi:hypothetical protein